VIIKIIGFLFFRSRNRHRSRNKNKEESAGSILKGGFSKFKAELYDWERSEKPKNSNTTANNTKHTKPKRPKIRRVRKVRKSEDEIPRLYPD
jgi:hypothetical protein